MKCELRLNTQRIRFFWTRKTTNSIHLENNSRVHLERDFGLMIASEAMTYSQTKQDLAVMRRTHQVQYYTEPGVLFSQLFCHVHFNSIVVKRYKYNGKYLHRK